MQNDTCYILALIKRDDGERLLLGSGFYEFTSGLKHFNPNTFANDVVELQGTDGQLLAGQVRRSTTQVFEGVIGDGTTSKQTVEQKRREFFLFFRKQHHYTVVYIMSDGTAIKRDRGYITEAPAVQELYQFQPKWRIGLAFEDVNYYSYAEDAEGNEIYSFEATLALANIADGGLIWDAKGAKSSSIPISTTKNLMNYELPTTEAFLNNNGTWSTSTGLVFTTQWFDVSGGEQMVFSFSSKVGTPNLRIGQYDSTGTFITRSLLNTDGATVTLNASTRRIVLNTEKTLTGTQRYFESPQLEIGSTKTTYVAFGNPAMATGGYIFAQSTGGGPVVVTVNGVDNANPVWHVYGPATNPTLTNSTTGEALTWNGTVPSSQELIIDMGAQTATLEGANVFEYVSGSWVQLEPGTNRISYTAANTTKSSKVYWNEVVG